jgi:hypothetical protein
MVNDFDKREDEDENCYFELQSISNRCACVNLIIHAGNGAGSG